ncbi:Uncharacterised protein [Mycobacteroides abscessus subsp. abscessus]|nr:Uncharacterised protein [Mycobacteroides abscessus subsp. abscessus]
MPGSVSMPTWTAPGEYAVGEMTSRDASIEKRCP